ncbi:MAG: hypothetical protein ACOY0T_29405 [Myxococcota bacterium]
MSAIHLACPTGFSSTPDGRVYADVRLGHGDFEPVWASTPRERSELFGRVLEHIERLQRSRKAGRRERSEAAHDDD